MALLGGLALGCGAAPAPEAFYPIPPASGDGCAPALTTLAGVDEPTPLGFTAIDALNRLAGPRSSPLEWLAPAPNDEYELGLGPEQGSSTLAIDVRLREGQLLHRFREPLLGAPDDTTCDPGQLEIPVTVTLESGAQGLTESFDAMLVARAPYRGHISARLAPGALRGGIGLARVLSLDPARSFWLAALRFEADVWEGGSAGTLALELGASHAKPPDQPSLPPEAPVQPGSIASWPEATECAEDGGTEDGVEGAVALPADAKVLGFSVEDVLEELRSGGPRPVTWDDGGDAPLELELELGAGASELCQAVGESLSFSALLRARSDAEGIDVRFPVRVEAIDAGGRVGAIRIESADPDVPYSLDRAHERTSGAGTPSAGMLGASVAHATGATSAGAAGEARPPVLIGVEWTHDGARDSGFFSLREVDSATPDASGVYASSALANARW